MPPKRETVPMPSVMMSKRPTMPHPPEGEGEHTLAKTHLTQTFFVAFDLDTEAILGFDNPEFVDYIFSHCAAISFQQISVDG